jgi:hypothetical protein
MPEMYVSRRTMTYGRGNGAPIDRGQILELEGLVNDEKLVRLGYVTQASKGIAIVQCGKCGARFSTDEALSSHGRERHAAAREMNPAEEAARDARFEKKMAMEDEIAPLDLTKTAASRGVRNPTRR